MASTGVWRWQHDEFVAGKCWIGAGMTSAERTGLGGLGLGFSMDFRFLV